MPRGWILILFSAVPAFAQFSPRAFSSLATTRNGDQVFFASPLRQRGTDQVPHYKLFVWTENGIQLLYQHARDVPAPTPPIYPYDVSASDDGSLVAFSIEAICLGGSSCFTREQSIGTVLDRRTGADDGHGPHSRISRNGRYELWWVSSGVTWSGARSGIVDRMTGRSSDLSSNQPICGDIASNGTAAVLVPNGLMISKPDAAPSILTYDGGCPRVDDSGTLAVFTRSHGQVEAIQLATGSVTQITPDGVEAANISLSADGSSVLYVAASNGTNQVFISSTGSPFPRQLTNIPEGVWESAISGDGRIAWTATMDDRLLKIDTATGGAREVLAPPILGTVAGSAMPAGTVVPGSLVRITGRRLGNRVRFGSTPGAVTSAQPEEVLVQVPWDLLPAETGVFVYETVSVSRDDSPLEAVTPEFTSSYATFRPAGFYPPIHQDWSGFVTQESPARPGEVLHIYATGLGPTDCSIPTGQPAPIDRLCRITKSTEWDYWWTSSDFIPAEVLFSGLAPGIIGLYQMEVRVPDVLPANRLKLIADRFGWNVAADFLVMFP